MNKTIILLTALIFAACVPKTGNQVTTDTAGDSLQLKYAQGFEIISHRNYKEVIVRDPWGKSESYARYYLTDNATTETPADGVRVKIPLKSLATASVTHYEFLSLLDELETITGICQADITYNPAIRERFATGKITDLGDPFHINVELTMQLHPEALMMSGYNQNDPNSQRIGKAGIPVIYNNEWMEKNLLGRAEWIKFVAAFYHEESKADSIFNDIEQKYNSIRDKARAVTERPRIMAGSNFRGTWYMPAGKSFMGQLFADAGSDYFYANDTTTGSLPLNTETVIKNFAETDVWLNCNFSSIEELLNADRKHALFNPVKTGTVYNFNKRMLPGGANDFWESAIARPDLLLSDVIAILHPEILPGYELFYAEKLTDKSALLH